MTRKIYILFYIAITSLLMSSSLSIDRKEMVINLLTKEKNFVAGKTVSLTFDCKTATNAQLYISHSYGKTVLNSSVKNNQLTFVLPKIYSNKTGKVSWLLIVNGEKKQNGSFEILPNNETKTLIESYLGPPSTLVSDGHFVMYVTIPTDSLDNPKPTNTPVIFKEQFLNSITSKTIKTKDLIAWNDIYAPTKSGVVLISAECDKTITKEYDAVIYPGIATNFSVLYKRNHEFADGNQITTLKTSIIKDKFGNIVSDGTMVSFIVTNSDNKILKSFGTTIDGVATTKILHPDHKDILTIKAMVAGIAQSSTIAIQYKPINPKIDYSFTNNNRTIIVGPIRSFMNQLVPDGIKVTLNIYHNNQLIDTLQEDSYNGKATFNILDDYYKEKNYSFEITTLGNTVKTGVKNYDNNK